MIDISTTTDGVTMGMMSEIYGLDAALARLAEQQKLSQENSEALLGAGVGYLLEDRSADCNPRI